MSDSAAGSEPEPELSTWKKAESEFRGKQESKFFDPCAEFSKRSFKCLARNGGDRTMCTDYFQAYRDCKKEWMTEMKTGKPPAST